MDHVNDPAGTVVADALASPGKGTNYSHKQIGGYYIVPTVEIRDQIPAGESLNPDGWSCGQRENGMLCGVGLGRDAVTYQLEVENWDSLTDAQKVAELANNDNWKIHDNDISFFTQDVKPDDGLDYTVIDLKKAKYQFLNIYRDTKIMFINTEYYSEYRIGIFVFGSFNVNFPGFDKFLNGQGTAEKPDLAYLSIANIEVGPILVDWVPTDLQRYTPWVPAGFDPTKHGLPADWTPFTPTT
ncbi:hypothetical protein [Persicobacter sp. CCB-QB2]|uniref:hypothetical protein n=1 Tax=Persicobacter sp. CCB-QB2 TaxID=1561025 RepID=UPI0006A9F749|nr:hypothetical protein [Persicobacter sp. CCB-QB2]